MDVPRELKPHAFHLNLPEHHRDDDGVPHITKFAEKKSREILRLAKSIRLTEDLFYRNDETDDGSDENDDETNGSTASGNDNPTDDAMDADGDVGEDDDMDGDDHAIQKDVTMVRQSKQTSIGCDACHRGPSYPHACVICFASPVLYCTFVAFRRAHALTKNRFTLIFLATRCFPRLLCRRNVRDSSRN